MNIDVFKNAHNEAKNRGWWDNVSLPLTIGGNAECISSKLALCHSEVTEAFDCLQDQVPLSLNGKPEGFSYEIADVLIRMSDLIGAINITHDDFWSALEFVLKSDVIEVPKLPVSTFLLMMHRYLSRCLEAVRREDSHEFISSALSIYVVGLTYTTIEHCQTKQNYNKTRGHKHGGKKI